MTEETKKNSEIKESADKMRTALYQMFNIGDVLEQLCRDAAKLSITDEEDSRADGLRCFAQIIKEKAGFCLDELEGWEA